VFNRILIKEMPLEKTVYAVKDRKKHSMIIFLLLAQCSAKKYYAYGNKF